MAVSPENVTVVAGRYRLDGLIGEGGMASVWRAKDLTLARPVAVKILYARDDRDEQALVDQFLREARIAAAVQHRNVIHIVDFGTTSEGRPFMVMELLEGESLGERMHRGPPLTVDEVVHSACMTLRGLAAVHEAGIIHRDLKPDNIFLKTDGNGTFPKILDFGISRSVEPSSGRRSALTTKEGIIVGTPEYMSPEQARGLKEIDKRTDLYSMGVIMYECFTGQLPFRSENIGDLIIQIVTATAPTVHDLNPSIPMPVSRVIEKSMSRAPADRYRDATEMQQALLEAAETAIGGNALRRSISDLPPTMASMPARAAPRQERPVGTEMTLGPFEVEPAIELAVDPAELQHTSASPEEDLQRIRGGFRAREWAFALLVLGGAGAAWALGVFETDAEPTQIVASQPVNEVLPAPPPEPEVVEPEMATVRLRNLPEDAVVTVDGKPMAGDSLELPKDTTPRVIHVSAPGKVPWQVVHATGSSAVYDVWLADKNPPRAVRAPARARPKPKPKPKAPAALRKLDF